MAAKAMNQFNCKLALKPRPRSASAFTLIEVISVASVILVFTLVSFRSMFTFQEQRKLRTAAIELSGYLQVARNTASAANIPCTIALSQGGGGIFLPDPSVPQNSCQGGTVAPAVRLGGFAGSRNLNVTQIGAGSFPLTFTPEGTVRQGATVLISSSDVPDGGWCVDVQAPLATVRLGWQPTGGTCNYAVEQ